MFSAQEIIGLAAVLVGLFGAAVYIHSILRGQTRPHVYTHLVWAIIAGIGFAAQLADHAGPGAWAMGMTTMACATNAILALKFGEKNITRSDTVALAVSLAAIVPWVLTHDPLWSVILISLIDVVAFYPTLRKSWHKPWEENLSSYNIANLKMGLSVLAITNLSLTTALYPCVVFVVNAAFVIMCLARRRIYEPV